jgi:hypothetical protein
MRRIAPMAERHCSGGPSRLEQYATQIVLGMLERMSGKDRGSCEALCFGFHVRAVKTSRAPTAIVETHDRPLSDDAS